MNHPSAIVILLPSRVPEHRLDSDWNEQHTQEKLARLREERVAPHRTAPMLVDLEKYK